MMRVWPAHILAPLLLLLILTGGTKLHAQPLPPARTVWLTTQGDTVVVSRTDIVSFDTASRTLRVSDTILQRLIALNWKGGVVLVYGDEGRFCNLYFFRNIFSATIDRPRWVRTNLDTLFSPNGEISYQGGEWQCNGYGDPTISGDSIPSAIHLLTSTGDTLKISREEIRFVGSGVIELDSTAVERIRSVELIDGSMEIWREGTLDISTGFLQDHGTRRLSRSGLLLLGKVLLIVDDKYLVHQQWHER